MYITEEIEKLAEKTKTLCSKAIEILKEHRKEAVALGNSILAKRYDTEVSQIRFVFTTVACINIEAKERNISIWCPILLEYCKKQAATDLDLIPEIRESVPEIMQNLEKIHSLSVNLLALRNGGLIEDILK